MEGRRKKGKGREKGEREDGTGLPPHLYSVTALPSKTYTTANTDATFSNMQCFKFHSNQSTV